MHIYITFLLIYIYIESRVGKPGALALARVRGRTVKMRGYANLGRPQNRIRKVRFGRYNLILPSSQRPKP
jgi:hypothetical protein